MVVIYMPWPPWWSFWWRLGETLALYLLQHPEALMALQALLSFFHALKACMRAWREVMSYGRDQEAH